MFFMLTDERTLAWGRADVVFGSERTKTPGASHARNVSPFLYSLPQFVFPTLLYAQKLYLFGQLLHFLPGLYGALGNRIR